MGDNSKRPKTKWTELDKRTGDFAANNLTSVTFNAVHPFVTKLPWSELSLDDDPFRGGQTKVSVLIGILRGIMLPHMVPYLETFETGSEMQTRPWLLSMIASFLPLVTQSLNVGDTQIYLKVRWLISEGLSSANEVRLHRLQLAWDILFNTSSCSANTFSFGSCCLVDRSATTIVCSPVASIAFVLNFKG
jgi:hypothetical protein